MKYFDNCSNDSVKSDEKDAIKGEKKKEIMERVLGLRNALLLYRVLKKERIREVKIVLDGIDGFINRYPYSCKFRTAYTYPKK
jgi:hypothetical protein